MTSQNEWQQEVRNVYARIKSHKEPYAAMVDGIDIDVFPDVFSPAYFTDSAWFAQELPKIVGKHSLLEIGTGTGIVALFAARNGATVTATDINPAAIENATHNFRKHTLEVKTYLGDMYTPLPSGVKFDFIFWNHPFNRGDNPDEEPLLKAGFDYHYESLEKYIAHAHQLLTPHGRLLLGTGGFALLAEIEQIAVRHQYRMHLLKKTTIPLSEESAVDNDYRIYELVRFKP